MEHRTLAACPQMCLNLFTVRPASLLCRFIAERASGRFSLASANSLDTSTPNSASSLQPPHFQPSPGGPLWWESQPHMVDVPSAQERVTANATPAEAMAWTNADSLVAERDGWRRREGERDRERVSLVFNMDRAICTAANTQTEALKGTRLGGNLLTQHLIFERAHLCKNQEACRKTLSIYFTVWKNGSQ